MFNSGPPLRRREDSGKTLYSGFSNSWPLGWYDRPKCKYFSNPEIMTMSRHFLVLLVLLFSVVFQTYFRLSMCRPDACYASDYTAMVRGLVGSGFPELFQDFMCQTKESNRSFTAGDIITLWGILSIFVDGNRLSLNFQVHFWNSNCTDDSVNDIRRLYLPKPEK